MNQSIRSELAAAAARLIAEEGCDYAAAKRRAAEDLLGRGHDLSGLLPDNREVEREVRRHLRLFASDTHPRILAALRAMAVDTMERLQDFEPHLIGAVLTGTATEHSDIHLHLYVDSAKDVEMRLIEAGIDFDAREAEAEDRPSPLELLSFTLPCREAGVPTAMRAVGVWLHVYERDARRVALRGRIDRDVDPSLHAVEASGRANLAAVRQLIADQST